MSGVGNNVFSIPSSVTKLHIVGTYTGTSSNFIVWLGPSNVNCDSQVNSNCHLLVNEIIGTSRQRTVSDGTYQTTGQTNVAIVSSAGVSWTFTEVR